jgi:ATP-dependent Zn protease
LPLNDQTSVTLKEFLARIDVSMGGRVAEELSEVRFIVPSSVIDMFH